MIAQLSDQCSIPGTGRKPAWMLGLRRKRTNLHEKYDYPWYVTGTPELLAIAASRFEQAAGAHA